MLSFGSYGYLRWMRAAALAPVAVGLAYYFAGHCSPERLSPWRDPKCLQVHAKHSKALFATI